MFFFFFTIVRNEHLTKIINHNIWIPALNIINILVLHIWSELDCCLEIMDSNSKTLELSQTTLHITPHAVGH